MTVGNEAALVESAFCVFFCLRVNFVFQWKFYCELFVLESGISN